RRRGVPCGSGRSKLKSSQKVAAVERTASVSRVACPSAGSVTFLERRRLVVPLPDQAEPLEGEVWVDLLDRPGMRDDQLRQPAGGDRGGVRPELATDRLDDAVHLTGEAVDDTRLQARNRRLPDDARRLDE